VADPDPDRRVRADGDADDGLREDLVAVQLAGLAHREVVARAAPTSGTVAPATP
jgi:hypothetical protein